MQNNKVFLAKGMRDFDQAQIKKREYLIHILKENFQKYGFVPLQTPAIEPLAMLSNQYGEEGEELIFKILNSGDFLAKTQTQDLAQGHKSLSRKITDKGLRYDLTVPLARYIGMHKNELIWPFKRYQIQPVWRADRPQKARYREFYQADIDIISTYKTLVDEIEIFTLIQDILLELRLTNYQIKFNHRLLIKAITEFLGEPDKETVLCMTMDKLDKIGKHGVIQELHKANFSKSSIDQLDRILNIEGNNQQRFSLFEQMLQSIPDAQHALYELKNLVYALKTLNQDQALVFDPTLARGLHYYTGIVFEITLPGLQIGSIGGGGRYDKLNACFGFDQGSGIGFSFGIDRLYEALDAFDLFPKISTSPVKVLITHLETSVPMEILKILQCLRKHHIATEVYTKPSKLKNQLDYANKKNIPYVLLWDKAEAAKDQYILKNMDTGEQTKAPIQDLIQQLNRIS